MEHLEDLNQRNRSGSSESLLLCRTRILVGSTAAEQLERVTSTFYTFHAQPLSDKILSLFADHVISMLNLESHRIVVQQAL